MNSQNNKNIDNLIIEIMENGIVSKAQLYQELKTLTDNFSEPVLKLFNEDIITRIKDLEFKYKPLDWSNPFMVVAPKVYSQKMTVIKNQLSNLNELIQFIVENTKKSEFKD